MKGDKTLSVFVDESGRFKYPDPESHYYIVGLVFHDQDFDIAPLVRQMDRNADELGLDADAFTFHAGPIIRQVKCENWGMLLKRSECVRNGKLEGVSVSL